MKIYKILLVSVMAAGLLFSCKKDDGPDLPSGTVTPAMARDTVFEIMNDWYYWASEIPSGLNKNSYPDPYAMLEAMRYKRLDRWSFVADYDEFEAEMKGDFVGHGFVVGLDNTYTARVVMIYSGSDLYQQGVRRGWIVKKINGTNVAPLLLAGGNAYSQLIGAPEAGVTNTFLFGKPDGSETTISSAKSSFQVNSVIQYDTLHLSSGITGHIVLESFIQPTADELEEAFAYFRENNIQDLILDLRYNGGGYLDIAEQLSSYIVGNGKAGSVFSKLEFNDMRSSENTSLPFLNTQYSLGLSRLVVITTRSTASASEAVMNSLSPHLDVVSVGDTTNGKPTGMLGASIGKKYWFWPVTFKLVNSQNEGDYFEGIAPDRIAPDDITHDFGDRREACLSEAITYLETGAFRSAKSYSPVKNYPAFSEKPSWMNNTFVRDR